MSSQFAETTVCFVAVMVCIQHFMGYYIIDANTRSTWSATEPQCLILISSNSICVYKHISHFLKSNPCPANRQRSHFSTNKKSKFLLIIYRINILHQGSISYNRRSQSSIYEQQVTEFLTQFIRKAIFALTDHFSIR